MTFFSQGQTLVGGPQAAVLAPPHLCTPSHSQALFLPLHPNFQLGCSEEVVKETGRAALQDPGRFQVRRHGVIPTNLPGARECLPTQCGQGSSRTLHRSLPASEAQDCDSKSHSYGGPSASSVSMRSSSGADRQAPGMTLQVPDNLREGREGVFMARPLPDTPSLSSNRHSPSLCTGRTTATPLCAGAGMSSGGFM